jgi:curved DNA-binding protein CbpA
MIAQHSLRQFTNNQSNSIRMNGQLSENPLAELIREISIKNLSGRLKLQQNKVNVAVYFQSGKFLYAACNIRTLRLGEYLVKSQLVTAEDLRYLGQTTKDFDLAKTLTSEKRISPAQAQEHQVKQVSDILRLVLLWTEGSWEFDHRSHLNEKVNFTVDVPGLLIETARRLPFKFTASRLVNSSELISPVINPPKLVNLLPTEVFLLSRVDAPMALSDLVAISGLREPDALRVIYSLALVGLISRERWKSAFRGSLAEAGAEIQTAEAPVVEQPVAAEPEDNVESFLNRLSTAESHYELLAVESGATMSELKNAYYDIARKYHPDRFQGSADSILARVESAFARVAQAYDTLRDPGLRASYDSKLDAQKRAARLAASAPKASKTSDESEATGSVDDRLDDSALTTEQRAEIQFKEGFAALELGQRNIALGLLGSAARSVAHEPRYRAYYGRALALHESTRRLAEAELQAAVKLEPNNADYRIMLAELYRDLGFTVRARSEAERAIAADRNNRKARDLLRSLS